MRAMEMSSVIKTTKKVVLTTTEILKIAIMVKRTIGSKIFQKMSTKMTKMIRSSIKDEPIRKHSQNTVLQVINNTKNVCLHTTELV